MVAFNNTLGYDESLGGEKEDEGSLDPGDQRMKSLARDANIKMILVFSFSISQPILQLVC